MEDFRIDNGTVIDSSTQLMWLLPRIPEDRPRRYVDAEFEIGKLCADAHKGFNNWRLSTREELENVMKFARTKEWLEKGSPSLSEWFKYRGIYINADWYWTCIRWDQRKDNVWCVNFHDGEVDIQHEECKHYFWPVRTIE